MSTDLQLFRVDWKRLLETTAAEDFFVLKGKVDCPWITSLRGIADLSSGNACWAFGDDWLKVQRKVAQPLRNQLKHIVADISILDVGLPYPRDWQPNYRTIHPDADQFFMDVMLRRRALTPEEGSHLALSQEVKKEKATFSYSPTRIQEWLKNESNLNWTDIADTLQANRPKKHESWFTTYQEWATYAQSWKLVFQSVVEVPGSGLVVFFND